ncbi:hypothetical protein Godav_015228 [Gossypium davidsonii]|uniref:Uncharacterized protein n=1 Tax=Gossypium davidsonii TaxID=34287 RepID=A0A7J8RMG3_GOSDV|nr:hypothetical protein [Gossypium davidsonii]
MDGLVVTGSVHTVDWGDICEQLLGGRYKFLPIHEPIAALELAYYLEYMSWFRVHGKTYLLSKEVKGYAYEPPSPTYYMSIPSTFLMTMMSMTTYRSSMFGAPTRIPIALPLVYGTQYSYTLKLVVSQIPPGSLFYQGGPSLQPLIPRRRIHDGNQRATDHNQLWIKAKNMRGRNHNLYRRLNHE